mgnify:CR=1 FL=1
MKNKTFSKLILTAIFVQNFAGIFLGTQEYVGYAYAKPEIAISNLSTKGPDHRVEALEKVFEKYNSPLLPYASAYVQSADKHGVDWKLLPSIAGLESSFGKRLMPGSYNGYGWGGGHIYFASWEDGIDKINSSLALKYYGRGANTVWSIGPIYAESPTWAVRVNGFMNQIDAQLAKIEIKKAPLTI